MFYHSTLRTIYTVLSIRTVQENKYGCTYIRTVLDTDNLHFSEEFLDFPVRTDADIHADVLGYRHTQVR